MRLHTDRLYEIIALGLASGKASKEKYADMLGQLIKLNKNLEALTAEIKLTGEHSIDEIWFTVQNIHSAIEEMMEAIHHPFEVIEPNDVNLLPMKKHMERSEANDVERTRQASD